jgi:hypothetical protein
MMFVLEFREPTTDCAERAAEAESDNTRQSRVSYCVRRPTQTAPVRRPRESRTPLYMPKSFVERYKDSGHLDRRGKGSGFYGSN